MRTHPEQPRYLPRVLLASFSCKSVSAQYVSFNKNTRYQSLVRLGTIYHTKEFAEKGLCLCLINVNGRETSANGYLYQLDSLREHCYDYFPRHI